MSRDVESFLVPHARCRFVEHEKTRAQRERHHDFRRTLVAMRKRPDAQMPLGRQTG